LPSSRPASSHCSAWAIRASNFADVHVEFVLVHETDGGNLLLLERGDDVRVMSVSSWADMDCAALAKVVDGDETRRSEELRTCNGNEDEGTKAVSRRGSCGNLPESDYFLLL